MTEPRTFRQLMDEYRPSMQADVLHAWAADVIASWQGGAEKRTGPGDLEERLFMQGFGFAVAHVARDMHDDHYAQMITAQNGIGLSEFLTAGLDAYDLDALKVALTPTDWNDDGDKVQTCPDCGEVCKDLLTHLREVHGED